MKGKERERGLQSATLSLKEVPTDFKVKVKTKTGNINIGD